MHAALALRLPNNHSSLLYRFVIARSVYPFEHEETNCGVIVEGHINGIELLTTVAPEE